MARLVMGQECFVVMLCIGRDGSFTSLMDKSKIISQVYNGIICMIGSAGI